MRLLIRALLTVALTAAGCLLALPSATAAPANCFDPAAPLTVEEQRLDLPAPQQILQVTGYDRFGALFRTALCATRDSHAATTLVSVQGTLLWTASTARAQ